MDFSLSRSLSRLLAVCCLFVMPAWAQSSFVLTDIEVIGLERVSEGAVFSHLPVDVGDRVEDAQAGTLLHSLYASGLFDDIKIGRDGDKLVIRVKERPAIADISFTGNNDIDSDSLKKGLKQAGIEKGQVFNRSLLEDLERELRQQYYTHGKYNLKIDTEVKPLDGNRVDIDITISEGVVSKIKRVNIIGNEAYSDKEVERDFKSGVPAWWAVLSSKDDYSRQKFAADLEALRSYYLDRGHLNFNIDSTQVTMTPDKKDIYLNINISEGDRYTVKKTVLGGDLIFDEAEMRKLLTFQEGETFSRAKVTRSIRAIKEKLGEKGYAFATVDVAPQIDDQENTVTLNLVVKPGKRVYVRRINFYGNAKTRDEVFRREMRQLEGAWYSTPDVERSKVRIQRLPFVETVNIERRRVPGSDEFVDLDITVTERLAGSFSAGAGYSQNQGVLVNLAFNQDNFFGTGKKLGINFNNSSSNTVYSINYTNPYYTIDGISRGFTAFYRTTDAAEEDISDYLADRYGLSVNYGIPLTEYDGFRFSLGYENIHIKTNADRTPQSIIDFTEQNGNSYSQFVSNASFTHDTRDRTVFATKGNLQRLRLEASVPGSDLDYYKLSYRNTYLWRLSSKFTLSSMFDVAYGDSYSETTDLPFFEKYYAGGITSVRGYRPNRLGPQSEKDTSLGGNFRTLGRAELFFPAPFAAENRSVRMGAFVDIGNVFNSPDDFDQDELRSSIGLSFEWLSPIGPLTFSYADTLHSKPGDDRQAFQFYIGGTL